MLGSKQPSLSPGHCSPLLLSELIPVLPPPTVQSTAYYRSHAVIVAEPCAYWLARGGGLLDRVAVGSLILFCSYIVLESSTVAKYRRVCTLGTCYNIIQGTWTWTWTRVHEFLENSRRLYSTSYNKRRYHTKLDNSLQHPVAVTSCLLVGFFFIFIFLRSDHLYKVIPGFCFRHSGLASDHQPHFHTACFTHSIHTLLYLL